MLLPAVAVLESQVTAGAALETMAGYADAALVAVRRLVEGWGDRWYVLTVGELRRRLAGMGDEQTLDEVLRLAEVSPAETLEVAADAVETGDFVGIVLRDGRVLGIAALPAGPERGEVEALPAGPSVRDFGFRSRSAAPLSEEAHLVPVFYATDRRREGEWEGRVLYGADRDELSFGVAEVSIPHDHEKGKIERPSWWRRRESPDKHVVVVSVRVLERSSFVAETRSVVERTEKREALVFVHGYNVDFQTALRRTAQLAFDLDPPSLGRSVGAKASRLVPILYSWPSQGATLDYLADETNARWTLDHFEEVLRLVLTEIGAATVHVIAHSMGNRVLIEALRALDVAALPAGAAVLREVVFAAPDFDADTFKAFVHRFHQRGSFTLYASSHDKALQLSRKLRKGLRRAGESGDELVVVDGVQTIDASEVMQGDFLAHSYFAGKTLLSDIFYLLCHDLEPGDRADLRAVEREARRHWRFAKVRD